MGAKFSEVAYTREYEKQHQEKQVAKMEMTEFVMSLARQIFHIYVEKVYDTKYLNLLAIHLDLAKSLHYWIRSINYYLPFDYADEDEKNDASNDLVEELITTLNFGNDKPVKFEYTEDIKFQLRKYGKQECWGFYKGQVTKELWFIFPKDLITLIIDYVNIFLS
jgi:hypothetical protein